MHCTFILHLLCTKRLSVNDALKPQNNSLKDTIKGLETSSMRLMNQVSSTEPETFASPIRC